MWACQVCTLEQSDRRQTCAACQSVRPDAISTEFLEHLSSMSGFRNYADLAKKLSRKKVRAASMRNKPCPLHDQGRKRPCKQANNPLDICVHFQPNRSRCAPRATERVSHLPAPLAARSRPLARSRSQIHVSTARAARAATRRWHGPSAGAGHCGRLGWGQHFPWRSDEVGWRRDHAAEHGASTASTADGQPRWRLWQRRLGFIHGGCGWKTHDQCAHANRRGGSRWHRRRRFSCGQRRCGRHGGHRRAGVRGQGSQPLGQGLR